MGRKSETSLEDREVVVKLALEGKSLREIGKVIGRSRSTIHGIVRKFMDYGITSNKQGRGRKPILNETEKRKILLEILRDPHQSVPKLTSEIVTRIGRPVSCVTVRRVVRSVKTVGYQGITDVGDSSAEGQNDEENPSDAPNEQMEEAGELSNKKIHCRKKKMYQNIKKQMEFYFSDANLNKDHFLGKLMMKDPNIDISTFLRLSKIRALTTDARDIVSALRSSELLSVTEDGTKVFCTPVMQKENTDDSTIYKAFGSMDCHLSSQMAPQDLCSIHFEQEEEEEKSKAFQDEEMKGSSDEDSANPSSKKKVKLLLSGETNIKESDVGECEDDSESNQSKKMKKNKSDEYETQDTCAEHETVGDEASCNKKKTEIEGKVENTSYFQQSSIIEGQSDETKQKRTGEDEEDKSNDEDLQSLRIQFGKKKCRRGKKSTEEVEENGESVSYETSRHSKRKKCKKKSEEQTENGGTGGD